DGVSVALTTPACRAGRLAVVNPELVAARKVRRVGAAEVEPALHLHPEARALVDSAGADGELRRLLAIRVAELIEYQDAAYARSYVEFVTRVRDAERGRKGGV